MARTLKLTQRMEPIRVLNADDHPVFRNVLRTLLGAYSQTDVVGLAANGDEAVAMAASLQPDVILMDLQMPGLSGIEATRQILYDSPHIGVLVVTMFEDDHSVFAAMRAGARGYVLKDTDEGELLRAIQAVGNGEAIFSPAIATRLIEFFSTARPSAPPRAFPELSDREREIPSHEQGGNAVTRASGRARCPTVSRLGTLMKPRYAGHVANASRTVLSMCRRLPAE